MGWVFIFGFAIIAFLVIMRFGRAPRATWEMIGAALFLGIAGYAWQGQPGLAGSPHAAEQPEASSASTDEMTKRREEIT